MVSACRAFHRPSCGYIMVGVIFSRIQFLPRDVHFVLHGTSGHEPTPPNPRPLWFGGIGVLGHHMKGAVKDVTQAGRDDSRAVLESSMRRCAGIEVSAKTGNCGNPAIFFMSSEPVKHEGFQDRRSFLFRYCSAYTWVLMIARVLLRCVPSSEQEFRPIAINYEAKDIPPGANFRLRGPGTWG